MKRILTIGLLVVCSFVAVSAQSVEDSTKKESLYRGYIGGMMVHLGYGYGGILSPSGGYAAIPVEGMTSGIGGKIAVMLGDHLRVGTEGYVSTLNYGDNRSASLGWGGLSVDYGWMWSRWRCYLGVSVGGGSYKNIASMDVPLNNNTPQQTVWNTYAVFLVDPYVELNFALTKKIVLCAKVDRIMSPSARNTSFGDYSSGVRFYIGFMFTK